MELLPLYITYQLNEIGDIIPGFWDLASKYNVILFYGDMGAGKTTFVSELCRYLGTSDTVSSPTFALINEYRVAQTGKKDVSIFHMDLYRLNAVAEAINAGIEDCILNAISNHDYVFVEWPEKAPSLFTMPHLAVSIQETGITTRTMHITNK